MQDSTRGEKMPDDTPFTPILEADLTCPVCGHIEHVDIPPDY